MPKRKRDPQMSLFELAYQAVENKAKRECAVQARIATLQEELKTLYNVPGERTHIAGTYSAAKLVLYEMSFLQQEELWVANLNTRMGVIGIHRIYRGNVGCTLVNVGDIFRMAILEHAKSIIVYHNHPSGDPTPSPEDVAVTRCFIQGGLLLDIECLDHIVIAGGTFVSLKEKRLGFS